MSGENKEAIRAVEIEGEIVKVQTLANGLARLTIDLQEYSLSAAQQLMAWNRQQIRAVIEVQNERDTGKPRKTDKIHI